MRGSRDDDKDLAAIVLWLLATEQEAHVDRDGNITLKRSRHSKKRERMRNGSTFISKAEAKRLRKQQKNRDRGSGI